MQDSNWLHGSRLHFPLYIRANGKRAGPVARFALVIRGVALADGVVEALSTKIDGSKLRNALHMSRCLGAL